MENFIQLVAESFARHGLEAIPVEGRSLAEPGAKPALAKAPEFLPQHNFRKSPAEDPAP